MYSYLTQTSDFGFFLSSSSSSFFFLYFVSFSVHSPLCLLSNLFITIKADETNLG
jgi:hypothetical protein